MDETRNLPVFERSSNYITPVTPHRIVRPLSPGELPAPGAHERYAEAYAKWLDLNQGLDRMSI